ncbi:MAG TPA: hydrogenase, partial [Planctomycetota bacterium]|nr:hydrogenase [Planctomycetota bacterium]
WGCGYAGRGRFQYTASSFGQPLVQALSGVLAPRATVQRAEGPFPAEVAARVDVPDRVEERVFDPLFRAAAQRMAVVRRFQDGRITRYLVFIVGTLVVGLGWAVASRWVLAP